MENAKIFLETKHMTIKSLTEIADKFIRRASGAGEEYKKGIARVSDWQGPTAGAEDLYGAGVSAAVADGRFGKGVREVSNEEWKRKASEKGGANYGVGIRVSKEDFSSGYAPYREVVAGLTLPPKGPKGSPENYDRVRAVGEAQHNAKLAR